MPASTQSLSLRRKAELGQGEEVENMIPSGRDAGGQRATVRVDRAKHECLLNLGHRTRSSRYFLLPYRQFIYCL